MNEMVIESVQTRKKKHAHTTKRRQRSFNAYISPRCWDPTDATEQTKWVKRDLLVSHSAHNAYFSSLKYRKIRLGLWEQNTQKETHSFFFEKKMWKMTDPTTKRRKRLSENRLLWKWISLQKRTICSANTKEKKYWMFIWEQQQQKITKSVEKWATTTK